MFVTSNLWLLLDLEIGWEVGTMMQMVHIFIAYNFGSI